MLKNNLFFLLHIYCIILIKTIANIFTRLFYLLLFFGFLHKKKELWRITTLPSFCRFTRNYNHIDLINTLLWLSELKLVDNGQQVVRVMDGHIQNPLKIFSITGSTYFVRKDTKLRNKRRKFLLDSLNFNKLIMKLLRIFQFCCDLIGHISWLSYCSRVSCSSKSWATKRQRYGCHDQHNSFFHSTTSLIVRLFFYQQECTLL